MHDPTAAPARTDLFVSIVAVLDDRLRSAADFVTRAQQELSSRYTNYELVLVDNELLPSEVVALRELLTELPCIRIIRLARRFPTDTAIFAGLESAIGDVVVVVDPHTDPIDSIPKIVELNRAGNDIVQGVATMPGRGHGGFGRGLFFAYNRRFLKVDIPKNATNLIGLSRRAVNTLTNTSRNHRYLRHLIRHVGYRIVDFPYERLSSPRNQRGLWTGLRDAMEMVSSYSTHPLQMVTAVGVIAALCNLLYAVYVVIVKVVGANSVAEGWTTTSLQLSIMFFLISIIIAVQSEYIGRILVESRDEPSYFVLEEIESETLIADLERRNVSS